MSTSARKPTFYILETDLPIVMFKAFSFAEARELRKERWFLDDLRRLTTGGAPLWDGKSKLNVRPAIAEEVAAAGAPRDEDGLDELVLTYLVPRDQAR